MPQGLQVWDQFGTLILDTNMRLGRILGTATIGTTNGSVSDSNLSTGSPFWIVINESAFGMGEQPEITFAGTTLSWTWTVSGSGSNPTCTLLYGVY